MYSIWWCFSGGGTDYVHAFHQQLYIIRLMCAFMALWLYTDGKLSMLVHLWKHFSSTDIINKKNVLEGIHLYWYISTISYNYTILRTDLNLWNSPGTL